MSNINQIVFEEFSPNLHQTLQYSADLAKRVQNPQNLNFKDKFKTVKNEIQYMNQFRKGKYNV
jgi:hypothetical protein